MRLIRWPVVCLMLVVLLAGFFIIGQVDNGLVRGNFETVATRELDTLVRLSDIQVSVARSTIHGEDLQVTDPSERGRNVLAVKAFTCRASLPRFFERRIVLEQIWLSGAYVRVHQLRDGRFSFLSETAMRMLPYEPMALRLRNVLTWTADNVNPLRVFAAQQEAGQAARLPSPPRNSLSNLPVMTHGTTQILARGFVLSLPHDYPDLLIEQLTLCDSTIEIVPQQPGPSLILHGINGGCANLSSRPDIVPDPIVFMAEGFIGDGSTCSFHAAGSVDLFARHNTAQIGFAFTNFPITAMAPLAAAYTPYLQKLQVSSGLLSANGQISLHTNVLDASSVYMRVAGLTAQADALKDDLPWLRSLNFRDTSLEMSVPIDSRRPYVHIDEALRKEQVRTEIHDFEMRFNPNEMGKGLLDGILNKDLRLR